MELPDQNNLYPELSIVVPVYNEAAAIDLFVDKIDEVLKGVCESYEIVFIDDGSRDDTVSVIRSRMAVSSGAIKLVELTRNFGKDVALTAGIHNASGRAVVPIDVDLQDPPELIPEMLKLWKGGVKMVVPQRNSRRGDSWTKRITANLFYNVLQRFSNIEIPSNVGDFRLLDREIVNIINKLPERTRFMKGLFSWSGYSMSFISYDRVERSTGKSSWNYWKLWNFALDGIFSFSSIPLRIWTYLGMISGVLAIGYAIYTIFKTIFLGIDVPGYASIFVSIMFIGGLNLIGIGVLGEYIGRIFEDSKGRPLYLIKSVSESNKNETRR